ncbi:MAG: adenylate/guanylate cyclase domain-containing protein [Opitutaceae bacterium]|jgi:class 3 adenylate cyclase|nr:adenylate/guanylate cyclase domain-containing protein [Opitutaceae bacterium]
MPDDHPSNPAVSTEPAPIGIKPLREALIVWIIISLTAIVCFSTTCFRGINYHNSIINDELKHFALIASHLVNGNKLDELREDSQTDGGLYMELVEPLVRFNRSIRPLYYVYTVRMVDGKVCFILDTARYVRDAHPGAKITHARVMELYKEPDPALVETLKHGRVSVTGKVFTDEFGSFKGAYAPVYNNKKELVGAACVDLDMKEYRPRHREVINISIGGIALFVLLATIISCLIYRSKKQSFHFIKTIRDERFKYEEKISEKSRKNEELLANILPRDVARRLRQGEKTIADHYGCVTVMFIDLQGFTTFSSLLTAREVVSFLNRVFGHFDELVLHYKLEKIKTIGDSYMVVGGLESKDERHMARVASMALDIVALSSRLKDEIEMSEFNIRIGIATGPAVAGVIGNVRFAFDLWGDTVNTASRMESHSDIGKIQCNAEFVQHLKDEFVFEDRGEIDVRSKGKMRTWFLTGAKEPQ